MIAYKYPTYGDIVEEVMYRLGSHISGMNTDTETIIIMVNRSIQEIYSKILPYRDWAIRSQLDIKNGDWLTENYKSIERVVVYDSDVSEQREARRVAVKEFYSLAMDTNWQLWNRCNNDRPIYTIYGNKIYIAPLLNGAYGDPTADGADGKKAIVDCYMVPVFTENLDDKLLLPAEFKELIVLSAMNRILFKTSDRSQLYTIFGQINNIEMDLYNAYKQHTVTQKQTLDTFVGADETPFRPPTTIANELQKRV